MTMGTHGFNHLYLIIFSWGRWSWCIVLFFF